MTKSRVLIAFNGDGRGYPPLTRLIDRYVLLGESVVFIGRSSPLFENSTLEVSDQVAKDIAGISKSRYIRQYQNVCFFLRVLRAAISSSTRHVVLVDQPMRLIGLLLCWISRMPVTYLEYDESVPVSSFRLRISEWLMRGFARSAHAIVVPNNSRRLNFIHRYRPSCTVEILPNHPVRSEFIEPKAIVPYVLDRPLQLYYHGSFVKERMPISIVHAMKLLGGFNLVIKPIVPGMVGGDLWLEKFLNEARELGVLNRIQSFDFLTIEAMRNLGSTCQVGIAFYDCNEASDTNLISMWGASNKVVQYAAYGLAVLCSTAEPEMRSNIEIGAKFCNMYDPASIADAISEYIQDPAQLNRMRSAIHGKALSEWTFEAAVEDKRITRAFGISAT